ncbi:MAG: ParB/RepB/Spo0J family partition protein [Eubacteriales bacterium]|nr:ParB/RepB/Spo0J family partition protein [Eubacteriales bacterium]
MYQIQQHASANDGRVLIVSVDHISPSPYQPRRRFDTQALQQLAESIAQHGLIQPITVRQAENGYYELIAGERRWRACKLLGMRHIRARVLHVDDYEAAMMTMTENLQREDLNFFEEAQGYQLLIQLHFITQQQLAEQLGISQSAVANKLRLLRLSEQIRAIIIDQNLSERHARALLKLHDEQEQKKVAECAARMQLSVRQTEELVERRLKELANLPAPPAKLLPLISHSWRDWRLFANTMKSAVTELKQAGLPARFEMVENNSQVQMSIIVPKGASAD